MKNILIPNDFSKRTLRLIIRVSRRYEAVLEKLNIILFHSVELPARFTDMLFFTFSDLKSKKIFSAFILKCNQIQKRHCNNISSIHHTVFYGSSAEDFKSFLMTNQVDKVILWDDYKFYKIGKTSFDPTDILFNSGERLVRFEKQHSRKDAIPQLTARFISAYCPN